MPSQSRRLYGPPYEDEKREFEKWTTGVLEREPTDDSIQAFYSECVIRRPKRELKSVSIYPEARISTLIVVYPIRLARRSTFHTVGMRILRRYQR